ncbi:type VI secretion system tube protein TssD [Fibrella aquatilis]|uniref:Type VI secretion system needle protein Hcp n=1 Tax=Fibrella aquatilis TaxID=2817059 RepID=A0A939G6I0_9BACT|nr:type VI secretion system tube protein TssD [Fibrella aquatilis]MBO0933312.1 hypothetical protein [Fibrella aquatilis]
MAAGISAKMTVGGTDYLLNTCTYQFYQPTDHLGRAKAGVRSGLIEITILGNNHDTLTTWAINPFKMFDGDITHLDNDKKTMKTVSFKKAYCVSYRETLIPNSAGIAYQFELGISAAMITYNGVEHDNQWSHLKDTY